MMDSSTLFIATIVIVVLLVLVLVTYLILIIVALRRAGTHLEQLAGGLQKIAADTQPLEEKVGVINGALTKLQGGLSSVDRHLVSIAKVLKLV
jgi:signal transduction histidine kinase